MCTEEQREEIATRLAQIEKEQRHIKNKLFSSGFIDLVEFAKAFDTEAAGSIDRLGEAVNELELIVHGSERLGIAPLRDQVAELWRAWDRAKWALGTLGVTNAGIIVTYLLNVMGASIP